MAYALRQFGSILLPEYKEDGNADNLGTGLARTSWQELPNGTYFDNYYGVERRPQGIRPLTKEGVLIGDDATAIRTQIDDLRKNIGVRDKLTVQFFDGVLRWQWAVLKEVNTEAALLKGRAMPVQLTFETAAQHWYQYVQGTEAWTVGDDSFLLGDGTAAIGQSDYVYTLTVDGGGVGQLIELTHNGNIPATNLTITVTAGTEDITYLRILQYTSTLLYSGTWEIYYHDDNVTHLPILASGESLVIDCGAMTVLNDGDDAFADFGPTKKAQWLRLEPETTNQIYVYVDGNSGADSTISFSWYDHYA